MANGVLLIDPQNADAKAVMAKVQDAQARKKRPPTAPRTPRPHDEQAALTPAASDAQPSRPSAPAAVPTTAAVRVHFRSEIPEGTIIVWVNKKVVFRKNFGSHAAFSFRSRKQEPFEMTSEALPVPAGAAELLVNVTPAGKAAVVRHVAGNFPGGGSRTLDVHLSSPTELDAHLN
jgi:hypothetical protein